MLRGCTARDAVGLPGQERAHLSERHGSGAQRRRQVQRARQATGDEHGRVRAAEQPRDQARAEQRRRQRQEPRVPAQYHAVG